MALTPDNARGYSNLGSMYSQLRQWDKAFPALETATQLGPTGARWSNLATAYFRQQRYARGGRGARARDASSTRRTISSGSTSRRRICGRRGARPRRGAAFAAAPALGEDARRSTRATPRWSRGWPTATRTWAKRQRRAPWRLTPRSSGRERIGPPAARAGLRAAWRPRPGARERQGRAGRGVSREEIESTRSLDALRKDPAYSRHAPVTTTLPRLRARRPADADHRCRAPARRARRAVGCPRILIKRDDLTGLGLGGNKARKLEFLIADALRARARRRSSPPAPCSRTTRG